jgi:hypothetical protein
MNSVSLEAFVSELNGISPQAYRLGGGREEPDGAVSFMVRFLGRDMGITGELYIRFRESEPAAAESAAEPAAGDVDVTEPAEAAEVAEAPAAAAERTVPAVWIFEDLILEEPRERAAEEDDQRFDFPPYERFF